MTGEGAAQFFLTAPSEFSGGLCCHFGGHTLTRARTLSTHLDALLHHLVVSCYLFAVLPALLTQVGTYAAYPVVER